MNYHIEPRRAGADFWFVIVSSRNGQVIMTSEMYTTSTKRTQTMNRLAKNLCISHLIAKAQPKETIP